MALVNEKIVKSMVCTTNAAHTLSQIKPKIPGHNVEVRKGIREVTKQILQSLQLATMANHEIHQRRRNGIKKDFLEPSMNQ